MAPKLDCIVIVSGDGDFVPLIEHLQHAHGCRVEVMSFGKSSNKRLLEIADSVIDFDHNKRRFLVSEGP